MARCAGTETTKGDCSVSEEIKIGTIVELPQSKYMGWPRMVVEDVYPKQISHETTRKMALLSWLNKDHGFVRAEVPCDLLIAVTE